MERLYIVIAAGDVATKLSQEEKDQLTNILEKVNDNKHYRVIEINKEEQLQDV